MPIFVGGQHIFSSGKDEPNPIVARRQQEVESSLDAKRVKAIASLPKKRDNNTTSPEKVVVPLAEKDKTESSSLINYKQSSFISDMLQSDKD